MPQYQHYIPQFILRSFSHPYKPLKEKGSKKKGKCRPEKGKHRGDKVLNILDLVSDHPQLLELPVSRWFGQNDMYEDVSDAIKTKKDVEQELSKLESGAAAILQKVKKAHENDEPGIWLTRVERNKLRKFLFIMKYRGPGFHEKYFSDVSRTYDSEDRNLVKIYMAEKGMATPRDVWLHNLRTILDLSMDAEGKWMEKLPDLMFPEDARMFIFHVQSSYMAFCTPTEKHDEFILTDQCYNVFEGPNSETFCAKKGEYLGNTYLCYHEFGPVSPSLIIVLRSFILPEALEDMSDKIRETKEMLYKAATLQFPDPQTVKSVLADLPVAKARNSYSLVTNGRLELAPGHSGRFQSNDRFCFRFWPIPTKDVDSINSIFLDNLLRCKSVVFNTKLSFKKTLETYMTTSLHGFKNVGVGEYGARATRLERLERLSAILKILGSNVSPVWSDKKEEKIKSIVESFDDVWLEMIKVLFSNSDEEFAGSQNAPFWAAFHALGGSRETFVEDLDQSWRLYKLERLVYNSTSRLPYADRMMAHINVCDFILQSHPRRIWLYVKHRRWMLSDEYAMHQEVYVGSAPLYAAKTKSMFSVRPEDTIVKAQTGIDQRRLSELIFETATRSL